MRISMDVLDCQRRCESTIKLFKEEQRCLLATEVERWRYLDKRIKQERANLMMIQAILNRG
jgi:hypothetical protein